MTSTDLTENWAYRAGLTPFSRVKNLCSLGTDPNQQLWTPGYNEDSHSAVSSFPSGVYYMEYELFAVVSNYIILV